MRFLSMLEPTEAGFTVQVPDLAIITFGADIEAAKRAAAEAIQINLDAYRETGQRVPDVEPVARISRIPNSVSSSSRTLMYQAPRGGLPPSGPLVSGDGAREGGASLEAPPMISRARGLRGSEQQAPECTTRSSSQHDKMGRHIN